MGKNLEIYACSGLDSVGLVGNWEDNMTLKKYLKDGAEYFLYTYIPDNELYLYPTAVKNKRVQQLKVRGWIRDVFVPVYGNEQEMDQIIRSNIVETFNSKTVGGKTVHVSSPEDVLHTLVNGESVSGGVTIAAEILAAIITAIASVVTTLITSLVMYFSSIKSIEIQSKYVVPTEKVIAESVAEAEDWDNVNWGNWGKTSTASSKWLLLLALIPTALMMMKNKKK